MVKAQQWLNEKFPHYWQRREVKSLSIVNKLGQNKIDQTNQSYLFYNVQLEGELDLKDFYKLEYLNISGDNDNPSRYQKLRKIKLSRYKLNELFLHDFNEKINVEFPLVLSVGGRMEYESLPSSIQMEDLHVRKITTLSIKNCADFAMDNSPPFNLGLFSDSLIKGLTKIIINKCPWFTKLDLTGNENLTYLDCSFNKNLEEIKSSSELTNLIIVNVKNCPSLVSNLAGVNKLSKLKSFDVSNCEKLTAVGDLSDSIGLIHLNFVGCPLLVNKPLNFSKEQKNEIKELRWKLNDNTDKLVNIVLPDKEDDISFAELMTKIKSLKEESERDKEQLKELHNIILSEDNFNFTELKREVRRLKINDLSSQILSRKTELEQLINSTLEKGALKERVDLLLKKQKEAIEQKKEDNPSIQKNLETFQGYVWRATNNKEETQKLCQIQIELTRLEERLKDLQRNQEEQFIEQEVHQLQIRDDLPRDWKK